MPRKLPEPLPAQVRALEVVEQAARRRREADEHYVRSILEAHGAGLTATQIAPYSGTSYQAVQQVIAKWAG